MSNLVIGDIVRLKSGSPKMTVSMVYSAAGCVDTVFFIEDTHKFEVLRNCHSLALVLASPKEHVVASVDIAAVRSAIRAAFAEPQPRL